VSVISVWCENFDVNRFRAPTDGPISRSLARKHICCSEFSYASEEKTHTCERAESRGQPS
jgi:hypothetical protein